MNDNIERDSLSLRPLSLLLAGYQRPVFLRVRRSSATESRPTLLHPRAKGTSGKDAFQLGHYKDLTEIGNRT